MSRAATEGNSAASSETRSACSSRQTIWMIPAPVPLERAKRVDRRQDFDLLLSGSFARGDLLNARCRRTPRLHCPVEGKRPAVCAACICLATEMVGSSWLRAGRTRPAAPGVARGALTIIGPARAVPRSAGLFGYGWQSWNAHSHAELDRSVLAIVQVVELESRCSLVNASPAPGDQHPAMRRANTGAGH